MKMIIVTLGSMGDVLPFIALGIALRQRGHEVTVLSHSWDEQLIRGSGLEFQTIVSFETGQKILKNPDLFHPEKRHFILGEHFYLPAVQPVFQFIEQQFDWGNTVVIGPPWAYGARLAQEKLGVPLLTVLLSPWHFSAGSRISPPAGEEELKKSLNQIRNGIGLDALDTSLGQWRNSPEKIVGMFPEWFGEQEEWPDYVLLTNFPLFDGSVGDHLDPAVESFLAEGDRPLVFTPGTKMSQDNTFFKEAVEACQQLRKRAIFLALYPEQYPEYLPEKIRFFDYVPLSLLLSHADTLIYHGGIGTCSHGLCAGLPHLIVPLIYDQFDNANRVEALGVGALIAKEHYRGTMVANKIEQLSTSRVVQNRCQTIAAKLENQDAIGETCLIIEAMVQ